MKKIIPLAILMTFLSFAYPAASFAQGTTSEDQTTIQSTGGQTASEETAGKKIWEKLQANSLNCKNLSNDDFGLLGEYFMGQITGSSHEAMDNMMIQRLGENGEEQMHVTMGKRTSGCDPSAPLPQSVLNNGMAPMMTYMMGGGMMGNWSSPLAFNYFTNPTSMMNFGFSPYGGFSWVLMILFWILIIAGIIALIRRSYCHHRTEKRDENSALDVLKERYAKGEINKKEFEEKKKDLK